MKFAGLTRRDLLRWGALGGAGIATGAAAISACGDNVTRRPPGTSHAAAILEPEADSFIVSVWGLLARAAAIDVRPAASDDTVFSTVQMLEPYTAAFEVSGLDADTEYIVTIETDDGVEMIHRVRTAPRPDDRRPVRIAISADIDPYPEFVSDIIHHLIEARPELFISLGDFPYTDNIPAAQTESVYRQRHAMARTEPRVRRLLESVGVRAIYDDHEFRNDWDASWVAAEPARYAAAMKVYDEFFPLHGRPAIKYRRWRWGAHVECFLLDCRRYRSENAMPDGPDKTMLGATQRAWLVDGVKSSTATFKLVLTSVPLDFGDGNDHWSSFGYERNTILAALVGVPGLLFVSADQHWFADHRHAFGIREFQVGPLARGPNIPLVDPPPTGVIYRSSRFNAGVLDVDGTSLSFAGLGTGGEVFYKQRLTVADLTPVLAPR